MNRNHILLGASVAALSLTLSCSVSQPAPDSYTLKCTLEDSSAHGRTIYLMRCDDNKRIDSAVVEGKEFVFTGKADTASLCRIDVDNHLWTSFVLENGEIDVHLIAGEYNWPKGTPMNDEYTRIMIEQDSLYNRISQKRVDLQDSQLSEEEREKQWEDFFSQLKAEQESRCIELYKEHNDDAIGHALINSVFMNLCDIEVQDSLARSFGPWLSSTRYGKNFIKRTAALINTAEGKMFIDIEGKDPDGNPKRLSDYIGKGQYVLLDMWASWCGPCRGEIPNLAKIHKRYKGRGLTVLGAYVWDKAENLKPAMKEENITWPQIFDADNKVTEAYGVNGIPQIILFAPDGTIVKRDLRGEEMIRFVDKTMNAK